MRTRGYSLVIVLLTLGIASVSMLSLWAFLENQVRTTADARQRRQVFYVCDGLTRMVAQLAADYAREAGTPTPADFKAWLVAGDAVRGRPKLVDIAPAGYVVTPADVTINAIERGADDGVVPSGPFEGLPGRESTLDLTVQARTTDGDFACRVDNQLSVSEIGLFQFALYGGVGVSSVVGLGNAGTTIKGRVHHEGVGMPADAAAPLVFGGKLKLEDAIVTSSRGITWAGGSYPTALPNIAWGPLTDAPCLDQAPPGPMPTLKVAGTPVALGTNVDTLKSPPSTLTAYQGLVIDRAPHLTVPDPIDRTSEHHQLLSNGGPPSAMAPGLQYLLNPVAPGTALSERARLSYKADIRIINGMWYVRNPANSMDWPGLPVWSDHPGDVTLGGIVGQRSPDITTHWSGGNPERYSYYATNPDGSFVIDGRPLKGTPVVSYGALHRTGTGPTAVWEPGLPTNWDDAAKGLQARWSLCKSFAPACPSANCSDADPSLFPTAPLAASLSAFSAKGGTVSALTPRCSPSVAVGELLITAARVPVFVRSLERSQAAVGLLTMNFDVAALQEALLDTAPGELGAHFVGREFNGIVWISSEWPGKGPRHRSTNPTLPPTVPETDERQTSVAQHVLAWGMGGDRRVRGLPPFPLCGVGGLGVVPCSATETTAPGPAVGYESMTTTPVASRFASAAPHIGAIRLINARNINRNRTVPPTLPVVTPGALPNGLTIATDLALLVVGDVNLSSEPGLDAGDAKTKDAADKSTWVPVLLAGDSLRVYGNSFEDNVERLPTDENPEGLWGATATPEDTTIRAALLGGVPRYGGNIPGVTLTSLLSPAESTSLRPPANLTIQGSVVAGFYSVHGPLAVLRAQAEINDAEIGAYPANLNIFYDYRMAPLDRQPPGGPSVTVTATRAWER